MSTPPRSPSPAPASALAPRARPARRPLDALRAAGALAASVGVTAATALALAQSAPRASAPPAGDRVSETNPAQFVRPPTLPTASIGAGNGPVVDHAPSAGPPRAAPAESEPALTGPIGPADAARVLQAQMPRLRPCYDRARATRPTLAGRVELRVTLDRTGRVTQADATGLPDAPEVAPCLAGVLRETSFPRPEGASLTMMYPMTFVPPPVAPRPARGRATATARRR